MRFPRRPVRYAFSPYPIHPAYQHPYPYYVPQPYPQPRFPAPFPSAYSTPVTSSTPPTSSCTSASSCVTPTTSVSITTASASSSIPTQASSMTTALSSIPTTSSLTTTTTSTTLQDPIVISDDEQLPSNSNDTEYPNGGPASKEKKHKKPKDESDEDAETPDFLEIPHKKVSGSNDLLLQMIERNTNGLLDIKCVERILGTMYQNSNVRWEAIAGLGDVKEMLKFMVVYPLRNPLLFNGLKSPGKGLLLFGPPGNGKTLIGKCLATEARAKFFAVTASTFASKWFGDAEKLVRTLFEVARAAQPSIVFIDEVDALMSKRQDTDGGCTSRMKNELLACLDGCTSDSNDEVFVIGATNLPDSLDDAFRRRFTRRVYVPLPDVEGRTELFKNLLRSEKHSLSEKDFGEVVRATEGFSGADIKTVCKCAAMQPLKDLVQTPGTEFVLEYALPGEVRAIAKKDLLYAIKTNPKTVAKKDLERFETYNKMFGSKF